MKKQYIAIVLAGLLSTAAHAEAYIGGSVGQAKFKNIDFTSDIPGYSGSEKYNLDESSTAASIYAGYNYNSYLALEATLGGFDAIDKELASVGDMTYFAVQPKLSLPITSNFNIFAKAGFAYFSAETIISNSIAGQSGNTTISDSVITGMLGLGAEYAINERIHIRATWDYMRPEFELVKVEGASVTAEPDITAFSVGISYHF